MWLRRQRALRDLDRDIDAHLAEEADELVARGVSPDEARRLARVRFGSRSVAREDTRSVWICRWLDTLQRELRQSLRSLRREPGFVATVVGVLTVGIGAMALVFSLLHSVVLQPLPYPEPDRLVAIEHAVPGFELPDAGISGGLALHYRSHARTLERIGLYQPAVLNLQTPGAGTERVFATYASISLFETLGVRPIVGRLFTDSDAARGFLDYTWDVPVLLSYELWTSRFDADESVIGRTILLNTRARRVVGILPQDFDFPDRSTQIWMLLEPAAETRALSDFRWNAVARLAPGTTPASAESELTALLPAIVGAYPDATASRLRELRVTPRVLTLKAAMVGDSAQVLWTLFGGMACLLLIAAANVAGLFSVRADSRARDVVLRHALGAHRAQLARLFWLEAACLTLPAAALGLVCARAALPLVLDLAPVVLPRGAEIHVGGSTAAIALIVAALLAGCYGTLSNRWARQRTPSSLSDRTVAPRSHHAGPMGRRLFLVAQVALVLVLTVASLLMVRTYSNLSRRDLGFRPDGLLVVDVRLPGSKAPQYVQIYQDLVRRIGSLPGVEAASLASFVPLAPVEHRFPVEAGSAPVAIKFFLPGYFDAIGTSIVDGTGTTTAGGSPSGGGVLVSAALARRLYPAQRAVGRTVRRLNEDGTPVTMLLRREEGPIEVDPFTIAGIVADVHEVSLRDDAAEVVYVPIVAPPVEQSIVPTNVSLIVRSSLTEDALVPGVRRTIQDVDPTLSVGSVRRLDEVVLAARGTETFVGVLLVLAAGASLFMSVVGIYGIVAYGVRQRTRELGIRSALGATQMALVSTTAGASIRLVLVGAALGLVTAVVATRALRVLLFGVEATDPGVMLAGAACVAVAGVSASLFAARRAAGADPLTALREE